MQVLPKALVEVIEALGDLPGVGPRTAERYAYYLLKAEPSVAERIAQKLSSLHSGIERCQKTFALVEKGQTLSPLYTDPSRDKKIVAVVAESFDVAAIEKTGHFRGTYHVLGGLVSPIDGIGPEQLHITELVKRVREDKVKEIILATNASVEGESTALYIQQQMGHQKVKITRLARGLSVGVDLEYADQITLGRALEGRTLL
ncbi:recombination protein RecR [Candidatus Saccharibacteria bacterium]|nr:recombination protein RecR [Candidatus Saccharibacteria bacterium]MBI3337989.1 recombination protein RecR [Candidatus Saccharibacteria bacterium]